jgi:flagellar motility protein MotE (MotC chaperone)
MRAQRTSAAAIGGVTLITVCFLASAVLRLGDLGAALAQEGELATAVAPRLAGYETDNAEDLLAAIREREQQLEREAARLAERGQALAVAEARLAEQIEAFEIARAGLEETIALADSAAERDLAQMTAVYERMKPQEAAGIVQRMDITFAAGLLARMKPEIAAGILTSMEPETAYAITLMVASRNARAPRE